MDEDLVGSSNFEQTTQIRPLPFGGGDTTTIGTRQNLGAGDGYTITVTDLSATSSQAILRAGGVDRRRSTITLSDPLDWRDIVTAADLFKAQIDLSTLAFGNTRFVYSAGQSIGSPGSLRIDNSEDSFSPRPCSGQSALMLAGSNTETGFSTAERYFDIGFITNRDSRFILTNQRSYRTSARINSPANWCFFRADNVAAHPCFPPPFYSSYGCNFVKINRTGPVIETINPDSNLNHIFAMQCMPGRAAPSGTYGGTGTCNAPAA